MVQYLRYIILCFGFSLLFLSKANAGITESTLLDSLDLTELNQTQKTMFSEELRTYAKSLDQLYASDTAQWKKKVKEMLVKIKDGFRVYKLARDPAIEKRISEFDTTTRANVYILTWVEDAFLNNIFLRLAEAFYTTTKPDSYLFLKYKYKKAADYTVENPRFKPEKPILEYSNTLADKISQKQNELTQMAYAPLAIDAANGFTLDGNQQHTAALYKSVDKVLTELSDIRGGPILGILECSKFCAMNNAQRCAYILMLTISNYGSATYVIPSAGNTYKLTGYIKLDSKNEIKIEKEFVNDPNKFQEYSKYLQAWGIPYFYRGLIEHNYPQTKWKDYLVWTENNNNCVVNCNSMERTEAPPLVKFMADVLTAPFVAPSKILYGRNFIFETEEVSGLDRGLAFLDVPGIGVIAKTAAVKLGVTAVITVGMAKFLTTGDVITDIIKNSGVAQSVAVFAKESIKKLPEARRTFVFKGLTDELIKVEEIPDFSKVVAETPSDKWDDIVAAWKKNIKPIFKVGDKIGDITIKRIKVGSSQKVAVVGRKMSGHVDAVASNLKKDGLDIEIFSKEYQHGYVFEIDGKRLTWDDIQSDFNNLSKYQRDANGYIIDADLPNSLMYKANKQWAKKLVSEGYYVLDVGCPTCVTTESIFYNMELNIIF